MCNKSCKDDRIECSKCKDWVHIKCVPMSKKKLKDWELDGIMFICSKCIFPERQFDSIQVLHTSGNIKYKMQLSNYESTTVGRIF